ncbi:hypothetical protein PC128_g16548 [Phytophthora cactorum]|nr:hypothetical protein PC128_g16548 [Phytophthora cactorum]
MAKPLPFGSVLEASSVLNELLRPSGYRRDRIDELAVWDFLDYELANLREPTNIHLLAVKKALLYAPPVIAPPKQHLDIALTSAVATSAEWFDDAGRIGTVGLAPRDKFRLIGFAFPPRLINRLSTETFP